MPEDSDREAEGIELVRHLCSALHEDRIEYCHWKSNDAIDRSARGENDLDLLVVADIDRFEAIAAGLNFQEVVENASRSVPFVRHFYGWDAGSGRWVDLHVHERLIVGDDATKNYRLPLEAQLLASRRRQGLFMVPSPALELAVLVVRLVLKHGTPEALLSGRGSLSEQERSELDQLSSRVDPHDLGRALHGVPFLDEGRDRKSVV